MGQGESSLPTLIVAFGPAKVRRTDQLVDLIPTRSQKLGPKVKGVSRGYGTITYSTIHIRMTQNIVHGDSRVEDGKLWSIALGEIMYRSSV